MSDTPSKLRQPRKSSVKIDVDALNDGRLDPALLENLKIGRENGAVGVMESGGLPPQAEGNLPANLKKRKALSPSRPAVAKFVGGPTMTAVPRRALATVRAAVARPRLVVAGPPLQQPRKPAASAIDFGQNRLRAEEQESKLRIRELEQTVTQLTQQLAEHTFSQSSLQGMLQESEQRVLGLESFRRTLEQRVSNTEQEHGAVEREIGKLKRQLEDERDEATAHVRRVKNELSEQIARLEGERAQLEDAMKRTREALETAGEENGSLKGTLSRQSATILELESQISALKAKLQAAQSEIIARTMNCDDLSHRLVDAEAVIAALKTKLQEGETVRRRLHNTVQELRGNIRVFCRVRPLMQHELEDGQSTDEAMRHVAIVKKLDEPEEICMTQQGESAVGQPVTKSFPFAFDRVFSPHATQQDVFEEISQLVQSALDGYRVCIFAYGQTGSGKTFTMEGATGEEAQLGMIPRAVLQVFSTAATLQRDKQWQFSFEASYLEIYNETIRDLLATGGLEDGKHEIRHVPGTTRTLVTDLTVLPVETPDTVLALLRRASHNRAVAETLCNDRSSRSHSVFMLRIVGSNPVTGESIEGLLNLIDLAGSERLSQSGSTGDRLKETQAINKSLSSLGDVISALANKDSHVPYRNSKLTYLLQHSLGGNSKTLMFVNVSPSVSNFHETLCSLRFATKVNSCQIGTARRIGPKP